MIGMPGTDLDKETQNLVRNFNIGGIILFSRNISDPIQLASLCRDIKDTSYKYHGNSIFIATDQEGGRVARLKEPFSVFPGNEIIGMDNASVNKAIEFGTVTAREMKLVGLNMNMAPVMDVRHGKIDKHLEGRLLSDDPESVSKIGGSIIKSLQKNGVMSVAKHFPGLGKARFDPHLTQLRIESELVEIEKKDLPPFLTAINHKVSAIMTSHAVYPALDPEYPATLSSNILIDLLRKSMKFKGLIITDDLEMGAISNTCGVSQGALASFKAGADILLICENQDNVLESIKLIRNSILEDKKSLERLNDSYERIITTKKKFFKSEKKVSYEEVKKYFSI
jgi:beta-N-acetylhexosaminidase